jgi:hypothetical protein
MKTTSLRSGMAFGDDCLYYTPAAVDYDGAVMSSSSGFCGGTLSACNISQLGSAASMPTNSYQELTTANPSVVQQ